MAEWSEIKRPTGGMNTDDAIPYISEQDYINAVNMRVSGTGIGEDGYRSNIESTALIPGTLPLGINAGIGGRGFDEIRQAVIARYNSAGNNQLLLYNFDTNSYSVIYTDVVNSGGQVLLPFNPQNPVNFILINKIYVVWWAKGLEVGYTNLQTLASGVYGTVLAEDLSLLKPQCMIPPTGVYGSDAGQPANYWFGKLPVFNVQYVNADYNYSTWSTWSKRIVPYQQNTPTIGSNVGQNNYIIIGVNIGSIRATVINIARQIGGETVFSIIKSVNRSYVTALPNTAVNIATEIYEAYDLSTNTYYYASYGNEVAIPVTPTETDLRYDYIWPSNAAEKINNNSIALGDFSTLYARPTTNVTVTAIGYNPNISIPAGTYTNSLVKTGQFNGASGSGAGNHKRIMSISIGGIPRTGDQIVVILADIRNATNVMNYTYPVPPALNGNLAGVVAALTPTLPASSYVLNGDGTYTITFIGMPYFGLQSYAIQLFFSGAAVSNSIPAFAYNTSQQIAFSYRDSKGRDLPLCTDNSFIFKTPSYAQVRGQALQVTIQVNTPTAPVGAVDYQIMVSTPEIIKTLDTMATLLVYKGAWNAKTNSPTLAINSGNIGDTYQITTPSDSNDPTHYTNLGNGSSYPTGDYITNVGGNGGSAGLGQFYDVLPNTFGNLAGNEILAFSLNPLTLFNANYSQEGVNSVLVYDFAQGDRCALNYWIDGSGNINYFNNPCINLSVLGYDAGTNIVKLENSAALTFSGGHVLYNGNQIDVTNILISLYSPAQNNQSTSSVQTTTVFKEIGERYTITNGTHDVLNITIKDGGVYYKTRQFPDAVSPYTNAPHQTLATDFNYSDFYQSAYNSFGRPRTYYDELEQTERQASIITSQNYVLGSKNNGLNRYYPANIYGDGDGQISSSRGSIQILWQRGDVLVALQPNGVFYIPVNFTYIIVNEQVTGTAISEKLLNNGRYDPRNIGIGTAKESFCTRYDTGYFIDPNNSLPMEITLGGILPISGKMTQYFKSIIQLAYAQGKKLHMYYDEFYEEVILSIQAQGGIITFFPFNSTNWQSVNNYVIVPANVSATPNGSHSTASYNSGTGVVTYTPTTNYVGNDVATYTFNPGTGNITLNNCLNWTAGSGTVNPFVFAPQSGVPASTAIQSNTIKVTGNDYPVPISVTGGTYSVNGGAFTSSAGTVNANDIVQAQVTSSGTSGGTTSATVTIDSQSSTFTVTTLSAVVNTFNIINNSGSLSILSPGIQIDSTYYNQGISVPPGGSVTDNTGAGTSSSTVIFYIGVGYMPSSSALTASGYGPIAGTWTGGSTAGYITFTGVNMSANHAFTININP